MKFFLVMISSFGTGSQSYERNSALKKTKLVLNSFTVQYCKLDHYNIVIRCKLKWKFKTKFLFYRIASGCFTECDPYNCNPYEYMGKVQIKNILSNKFDLELIHYLLLYEFCVKQGTEPHLIGLPNCCYRWAQ